MGQLTQERLKELLNYDPESGNFVWKVALGSRAKKGAIAGGRVTGRNGPRSRIVIRIFGEGYYAHRLAFFWMLGQWPIDQVDHIDGNTLNNAWVNLREVTCLENAQNQKIGERNFSGVLGVYWDFDLQKYRAQIKVNKKSVHLGVFTDLEAARQARKKAEAFYGFHENHGRLS